MKVAIIGIFLALLTASNLFFYEKIVKKGSYILICVGAGGFYIITAIFLILFKNDTKNEALSFYKDTNNIFNFLFYMLTMSFSYVWFFITKEKNVELSSIYDVIYIPILISLGILFGEKKIDYNFIIASVLILSGVLLLNRK